MQSLLGTDEQSMDRLASGFDDIGQRGDRHLENVKPEMTQQDVKTQQ
jgi:hypothetical protein